MKEIMEIRSLEIDFDRKLLKINGERIKDIPVMVTLPGSENRFPYRQIMNCELATGNKEECDRLTVTYEKGKYQ